VIQLVTVLISANTLLQHVGKVQYRGQALYFGVSAYCRYDDPACTYGVLYLGKDLATALMESVFHSHNWDTDKSRSISMADIRTRMVRAVGVIDDIVLCDLTAPGVMAGYFGLNLEQMTQRNYIHTQAISTRVHALKAPDGSDQFDGILYPSRNNYPSTSIALFDRAKHKVDVTLDRDLVHHVDWPRFVSTYRVGIVK
jgi:hypothetical protein